MSTEALSSKQISRLCGVTLRQVQWWCERGLAPDRRGSGSWRAFTQEDALLFAVIRELRRKGFGHRLPDIRRLRTILRRQNGYRYLLTDGRHFSWQESAADVIWAYHKEPGGLYLLDVGELQANLIVRIKAGALTDSLGC